MHLLLRRGESSVHRSKVQGLGSTLWGLGPESSTVCLGFIPIPAIVSTFGRHGLSLGSRVNGLG
eukprot:15379-Rhodomonas_salina.1